MKEVRLIHINNGLGAGNTGDELMAQAFWQHLSDEVVLDVPLYPQARQYRGRYPSRHSYLYLNNPRVGDPLASYPRTPDAPGLLVGDTPVSEFEGLQFPLGTVGPTLSNFEDYGYSVDAIGVGVDHLHTPEGRALFARHYSRIRSWTVRSAECREALLDLGVEESRVHIAADLAWLFEPDASADNWAAGLWRSLGIRLDSPLLVVNLAYLQESCGKVDIKRQLAAELDYLSAQEGFQIAFLSNEARSEEHFDTALARAVQHLMREPAVIVPNKYYTPQEMVSLLRPADFVLSRRYHMAVQAVLAGTVPLLLSRGQKVNGLGKELGLPVIDPAAGTAPEELREQLIEARSGRPAKLEALSHRRAELKQRAGGAFHFFNAYLAADDYRNPQGHHRRPAREAPRDVLVSHLGGLGDVVLLSGLIAGIRASFPEAKIRLLCNEAFAPLTALYPVPPDAVVPLRFSPAEHLEPSDDLRKALRQLCAELGPDVPDLYVSADLEPRWLAWYLAARLRPRQAIHCTRLESPRGLLPVLLSMESLAPAAFSGPAWSASLQELERYSALLQFAGGGEVRAPRWELSNNPIEAWLGERGLSEYLVCFPTGTSNSSIKRWPVGSFIETLCHAYRERPLPVVLNGSGPDRLELQAMATRLEDFGITTHLFTEPDVQLLAGLMANATVYLGNDTGPAHLAQAFARPGAIAFGGGCWPAYSPWAPGTVAVVHPMPCFGCSWDCAFGRGLCVESIPPAAVQRALHVAPSASSPQTIEVGNLSAFEQQAIEGAARKYRGSQEDRERRFQALVEIEYNSQHEHIRNMNLETEVAGLRQRLAQQEGIPEEQIQSTWPGIDAAKVEELEEAAEQRLIALARADALLIQQQQQIEELSKAAHERLVSLHAANAAVQNYQSALRDADAVLLRQSQEIAELATAARDRLTALQAADELLRRERNMRIEQEQRLQQFERAAEDRLSALQSAAESLLQKNQRIAELAAAAEDRLAALQTADALLRKEVEVRSSLRADLERFWAALAVSAAEQDRERNTLREENQRLRILHQKEITARLEAEAKLHDLFASVTQFGETNDSVREHQMVELIAKCKEKLLPSSA